MQESSRPLPPTFTSRLNVRVFRRNDGPVEYVPENRSHQHRQVRLQSPLHQRVKPPYLYVDDRKNIVNQKLDSYRIIEQPRNRYDWEFIIQKATGETHRDFFTEAYMQIKRTLNTPPEERSSEHEWIITWLHYSFPAVAYSCLHNLGKRKKIDEQSFQFLMPLLSLMIQRPLVLAFVKKDSDRGEPVVTAAVSIRPGMFQVTVCNPNIFADVNRLSYLNDPVLICCLADEDKRFAKLAPVSNRYGDTHDCGICLEPFDIGRLVTALECDHPFHNLCIDHWYHIQYEENNREPVVIPCPLCRTDCWYVYCRQGRVTSPFCSESCYISHAYECAACGQFYQMHLDGQRGNNLVMQEA